MIGILGETILQRRADADVIDQRQVLNVFAQPHTTGMGTDRDPELRGQQLHGHHLVDTTEPTTVDLAHAQATRLHQLLESDPVLTRLTTSNLDRVDGAGNRGVAQDVIGAGRFLDEPGVELGQGFHPCDRIGNVPDLVGIEHQLAVRPDLLPDDTATTDVVLERTTDLDLEV